MKRDSLAALLHVLAWVVAPCVSALAAPYLTNTLDHDETPGLAPFPPQYSGVRLDAGSPHASILQQREAHDSLLLRAVGLPA
jgi:hypothetical protein